jgi:hypothetical protein
VAGIFSVYLKRLEYILHPSGHPKAAAEEGVRVSRQLPAENEIKSIPSLVFGARKRGRQVFDVMRTRRVRPSTGLALDFVCSAGFFGNVSIIVPKNVVVPGKQG